MANTLARQTSLDLWDAPRLPAMTSGGLRGIVPIRDVLTGAGRGQDGRDSAGRRALRAADPLRRAARRLRGRYRQAILTGASRMLGSDRPDVGIVFPTMTIAKTIAVQFDARLTRELPMRIAMFSTKPYDRRFFEAANSGHDIVY